MLLCSSARFRAGAEHVMVSFVVLVAVTLDGLIVGLREEFSKLAGCWRGWGCCDSLWISYWLVEGIFQVGRVLGAMSILCSFGVELLIVDLRGSVAGLWNGFPSWPGVGGWELL